MRPEKFGSFVRQRNKAFIQSKARRVRQASLTGSDPRNHVRTADPGLASARSTATTSTAGREGIVP